MRTLKAIFLTAALGATLALTGCGDDDDNNNNNPQNDAGTNPPPVDPPPPPPGPDGGPNPLSSFPAYTKSLIETQTADNTVPALEAVWAAIPDDDTAATATALFPAAFFP